MISAFELSMMCGSSCSYWERAFVSSSPWRTKLTVLETELLASRFCLRKDHELGGTLCEGSESCNGWTIEHDVVGNLVRSLLKCSLSMRNYVGVVPPYYSGYITIAMMRNYPLLMHKFMSNKAKIPYLLKLIVYMNLYLYSLKIQD
uniref:Cohesin subunit SCC3/SA HEAT-repeats domain-containing protein n=1 Tax=Solanum lycopersicum TaxID=4081 RepID=A0A3Q7H9W9_SOLLC